MTLDGLDAMLPPPCALFLGMRSAPLALMVAPFPPLRRLIDHGVTGSVHLASAAIRHSESHPILCRSGEYMGALDSFAGW